MMMMVVIKMEKKMVLSQVRCSLYLEYDAVAAIEEEDDDEDEVDGDNADWLKIVILSC